MGEMEFNMLAIKTKYPPQAFAFVQRGLDYTVRKLHGDPESPAAAPNKPADPKAAGAAKKAAVTMLGIPLPPAAAPETDDEPNARHVSGPQLCCGLRDFAIEQYGLLARTVLRRWQITSCEDFGHIVFAMVDAGMMRKTNDDRIEDFVGVFDFNDVFSPEMCLMQRER